MTAEDQAPTCVACGNHPVDPAYQDVGLCQDCATDAQWYTEQVQ